MRNNRLLLVLVCCIAQTTAARKIKIHNKTTEPVYYATYLHDLKSKVPYVNAKMNRKGSYTRIPAKETVSLKQIDHKAGKQRKGVFVFERDVPTQADRDAYFQKRAKPKAFKTIGTIEGMEIHDEYWITTGERGRIQVRDAFEQQVGRHVEDALSFAPDALMDHYQKQANKDNPYKDTVAKVRTGNVISVEEQEFARKRMDTVRANLEKEFGIVVNPDENVLPKIAIIASGGGYRAMLCALGFFTGAQKIGLTDVTMWVAGLSGGTWALGNWYTFGKTAEYARDVIVSKVTKHPKSTSAKERNRILDLLWDKYVFDQPITMVDIYGALLANRFFGDFGRSERQRMHLSDQKELVSDGSKPLPIYTAVIPIEKKVKGDFLGKQVYEWAEFTPYEVGSTWLNAYIPSWSYGRTFDFGKSTNFAPEQSFGFLLGTYGSAFAASFKTILKELSGVTKTIFTPMLKLFSSKSLPLSWAEVSNFSRGLLTSPIAHKKELRLVDAGLDFNLPYPPVSGQRIGRKADIIIVLDASLTVPSEFVKMEKYAKKHNLPYPAISYEGLDKRSATVFENPQDPNAPIIIYMPRVTDLTLWKEYSAKNPSFAQEYATYPQTDLTGCTKSYCNTDKFEYSDKNANNMTRATEANMVMNKDLIRSAIERVSQRKRQMILPS